jgi:hypothetical protein
MTEQEARTKVCKREVVIRCMYPIDPRTGVTEYEYMEYPVLCNASDCMMWRWNHCGLGGKPC